MTDDGVIVRTIELLQSFWFIGCHHLNVLVHFCHCFLHCMRSGLRCVMEGRFKVCGVKKKRMGWEECEGSRGEVEDKR